MRRLSTRLGVAVWGAVQGQAPARHENSHCCLSHTDHLLNSDVHAFKTKMHELPMSANSQVPIALELYYQSGCITNMAKLCWWFS